MIRHGSVREIAHLAVCFFLSVASLWFGSNSIFAEAPITALTFTPDGQQVLIGSQSGVQICNWPALNDNVQLETTSLNVHSLRFSPTPDDEPLMLAVGGGMPAEAGIVEVFDWKSRQLRYKSTTHDDSVLSLAWLPNEMLASASLDMSILLHDVRSDAPSGSQADAVYRGHSRGVTALCTAGENLVSGSLDQNIRVWNIANGSIVRTLNNHTQPVNACSLRPSHEGLPMTASISEDSTVRFWQPTIGRMVRFARLGKPALDLCWLPDGSLVVCVCSDGVARFVDPDDAEIVAERKLSDQWLYCVSPHPSDGTLAIGDRGGKIHRLHMPAAQR